MGNAIYNNVMKNGSSPASKYPSWKDGKPNLLTYLDALNISSPIVQCQFELVWSRWPRTIFFAKGITVPGMEVNTLELNHAGFTILIPTHVAYGSNEITMTILADKEGFHYYDMRNMVLQTAHPFVAGDTRATIGSNDNISDEDILDVRLRNSPEDVTHHHWIIHNFHPIRLGDVELNHDGSNFVEFELAGTFTHIDYDCGHNDGPNPFKPFIQAQQSGGSGQPQNEVNGQDNNGEEDEGFYPYALDPTDPRNKGDNGGGSSEPSGEESGGESGGGESGGGGEEEEEKATLDDDDDKAAYEIVANYDGNASREMMQQELEEKLKKENPNMNPELIETRAEIAMDNAEKYHRQNPKPKEVLRKRAYNADVEDGEEEDDEEETSQLRIVVCGDIGGWIVPCDIEIDNVLIAAIRYNHNVTAEKFKISIDSVFQEKESYREKITQLTLPHRFGMYKTQIDMPKRTPVDLDTPSEEHVDDSTTERVDGSIHRVRGIF